MTDVAPEISRADIESLGLVSPGAAFRVKPMAGGVSSEIVKVEVADRTFVVKRALAKLKVRDDWRAPVSRNRHEADWLEAAAAIAPGTAPSVLARNDDAGLFAMTYFDPRHFPVWKEQLRDGIVDVTFAASVGRALATIHAATAGDPSVARRFATDSIFYAIRLEPYFEGAARKHPEVAEQLRRLSARTLATKLALVHGDVSPKNILAGGDQPVFLDAECAWYGDPAFDLAFCLNHLLLKCLWNPPSAPQLLDAFDALSNAYTAAVTWEERQTLGARTGALLPALLLARVDGKSPVEYLREADRDFVREAAVPLIASPPASHLDVRRIWTARLVNR